MEQTRQEKVKLFAQGLIEGFKESKIKTNQSSLGEFADKITLKLKQYDSLKASLASYIKVLTLNEPDSVLETELTKIADNATLEFLESIN